MRKFSEDRKIRDIVYDDLLQKHYEKTSLDPTHIKISTDAYIQAKSEDQGRISIDRNPLFPASCMGSGSSGLMGLVYWNYIQSS
ncbi:hypothetical protein [Xanthomonas phage Xp15]|uniref:Uncharacterized protein n=1 Tax=Xanthomonas phage Xp15 TaxID=322855 RepID=Q52PN2_9CAUD|nr:hypothetical protein XPXV15_gp44 [Xanthomonas phage Xp15]AAX84922.1 hypothetical protein [Xanthomonas phage Xp15]